MRVSEVERAKDTTDGATEGDLGASWARRGWLGPCEVGGRAMSLAGGALQTGGNFPEGISYECRRSSSVRQAGRYGGHQVRMEVNEGTAAA